MKDLAFMLVAMRESESFDKDIVRFSVSFDSIVNRRLEILSKLLRTKKTRLVSNAAVELCKLLEEELGIQENEELHKLYSDLVWAKDIDLDKLEELSYLLFSSGTEEKD